MKRAWGMIAVACGFLFPAGLRAEPVINQFDNNGSVTWVSDGPSDLCSIQYASSPTDAWRSAWTPEYVVTDGGTGSVRVPMFYRVLSHGSNDGSLALLYRCDGNALDAGGDGGQGIVEGSVLTNDHNGIPFSAYSFYFNDLIRLPDVSLTNGYSVSLWFLAQSFLTAQKLFANESELFQSYHHLRVDPAKRLVFYVSGKEAQWEQDLDSNVWYHAAFTFDLTNMALYANGSLVATNAYTNSAFFDPMSLDFSVGGQEFVSIGDHGSSYSWRTNCLHGMLDEIAVWRRPLSSNEIRRIYEFGL